MSVKIIDVTFDKSGQIVSTINGGSVVVSRGDGVVWQSSQGDMTVTFDGETPFEDQRTFVAARGDPTQPLARVRTDAPEREFACTVTLGGKTQKGVSGVIIEP